MYKTLTIRMLPVFEHCPFLVNKSMNKNLDALIAQWKSHKYKKPVRGAVILNTDLTKVKVHFLIGARYRIQSPRNVIYWRNDDSAH